MEKIIKKYGNSLVIILNPEDQKIYDLKLGDIVEVTLTKIKKVKGYEC